MRLWNQKGGRRKGGKDGKRDIRNSDRCDKKAARGGEWANEGEEMEMALKRPK